VKSYRINIETILNEQLVDEQTVRQLVEWILQKDDQCDAWTVNIIFVDNDYIIDLNKRYFSRNTPTDVISFIIEDEKECEGEIYISVEQAKLQARDYDVAVGNELLRLVAHGVYHLLGYEDATPEQKATMTSLEDQALAAVAS